MFQPSDYDPNNVLALVNANLDFWVNSLALGDTYLLGTGTVSNFRGPFNRSAIPKTPRSFSMPTTSVSICM